MGTPLTINSLLDIADQVDAFFIDMFGVLWDGKALYPEALRICEKLIQKKKKIYVLTNTTMLSTHYKEKYERFGLIPNLHYTDVITSGDVFKFALEHQNVMDTIAGKKNCKYFLIGHPNDEVLQSVLARQSNNISETSLVYLGAPQKLKNGKYRRVQSINTFLPDLKKALQLQLPVICANPDYFAIVGGQNCITQGSLARWYEEHGGQVYWFGKPYSQIYDYVLQKTKLKPQCCIMIGDTIRTDILGGQNAGMKTVLITGYGVTHTRIQHGERLDQIIKQEKAYPDFLLSILQ